MCLDGIQGKLCGLDVSVAVLIAARSAQDKEKGEYTMRRKNEKTWLCIHTENDIKNLTARQLDSADIMAIDEQLLARAYVQKKLSRKAFSDRLVFQRTSISEQKRFYIYKVLEYPRTRKAFVRRLVSGFLSLNIGRFLMMIISYLALSEIIVKGLEYFGMTVEKEAIQMVINAVSLAASFLGMELVASRQKYGPFTGYWCYYVCPKTVPAENHAARVQVGQIRVAKIKLSRGTLHITGYQITKQGCREHFYSDVTEIQYSSDDKSAGTLFYCFSDSIGSVVKGLCALDWRSTSGAVDQMKGWYAGQESKVIGQLKYRRITKKEFKALTGGVC